MSFNLPPGGVELSPQGIVPHDNIPPSIAIAPDGTVYRLHFASARSPTGSAIKNTACIRVFKYPRGSVVGTEVAVSLQLNASSKFIEFEVGGVKRLFVDGHYNEYPETGGKITHLVSVPVPDVVGPFTIF